MGKNSKVASNPRKPAKQGTGWIIRESSSGKFTAGKPSSLAPTMVGKLSAHQRKREDLKKLIATLPNHLLEAAERAIKTLLVSGRNVEGPSQTADVHPMISALQAAPVDDEPETELAVKSLPFARNQMARGEVVSHSKLTARRGNEARRRDLLDQGGGQRR